MKAEIALLATTGFVLFTGLFSASLGYLAFTVFFVGLGIVGFILLVSMVITNILIKGLGG